MAKSVKEETVKIQPYPIKGEILCEGQPAIGIQILKVADLGLIFKSVGHLFLTNQNMKIKFELPVVKRRFLEDVKVMKTYESVDAFMPGGKKERILTVEVHFKDVNLDKRDQIREFISKIKQS